MLWSPDSAVLYIGAVDRQGTGIDLSRVRYINSKDEAEKLQKGEIVRRFDFVSVVDEASLRGSDLEPLRHRSDTLADAVVNDLNIKPGQDALKAIEDNLRSDEPFESCRSLWQQMTTEPPALIRAAADGMYTPDEAMIKNDRYAPATLANGQAVFWRYSSLIFDALGHFSLAGGFSAPKLAAVLNETGYLTSASKDATFRRLLETTLFVLDVMSDMRTGESRGWRSAFRVRLLHAQVRRRIKEGRGLRKTYDEAEMGVPINQADLLAVLGSFMIAPLWSIRRSGITLTQEECEAYQAAWRHVGYFLGIDVDLLERFYGRSFAVAESSFATAAFDVFPEEIPSDPYKTPTYSILSAISNRPPRGSSVGVRLEHSRFLLGPRLADQLAIPRGSIMDRATVVAEVWATWYFVTFGRLWRRGWDIERQDLFRHIMHLLVIWQLGERRTIYAWREVEKQAEKLGEKEGEEPGIVMGRPEGLKVKRRWKLLLGELVGVSLVAAGGLAWASWRLWDTASAWFA